MDELIKALRNCSSAEGTCAECSYKSRVFPGTCNGCKWDMMRDAADALEAIRKTVIPHRNYESCHIYWCECGWFLRNKDQTPNYCPNCGKRIEWGDAE